MNDVISRHSHFLQSQISRRVIHMITTFIWMASYHVIHTFSKVKFLDVSFIWLQHSYEWRHITSFTLSPKSTCPSIPKFQIIQKFSQVNSPLNLSYQSIQKFSWRVDLRLILYTQRMYTLTITLLLLYTLIIMVLLLSNIDIIKYRHYQTRDLETGAPQIDDIHVL